ncbi:LysR family transcriptional regulator [Georgenia subflava]|uniref:LysR family transcriptional regulator n=1 Tax=Georgenia subflava TaxID=1622177 RepID=A0A6N7ED49_9MICO|nr:LysR family transcriptional regulator [Georgenia subflava]MPV35910.1 LysR family transcriptional regulator [Georgenia subflava]
MDLLRHLRFFVAVADSRHFGDAARDLGMTQPPLSQGVRRLERQLGVRLFDRDARGVRITTAGQALLPSARELLRQAGELVDQADDLAIPDRVRLGIAGDLEDLLDDVVRALADTGAGVVPTVAGSVELVDLLRDGLLDLAVVRHPGVLDGLAAGPVLILPTRLEPSGSPAGLAQCELPIAVPPRHHQPPAHDQLVDALRRAGHSGDVVEAPGVTQRRALRAAGAAVQITPASARDGIQEGSECPPLRLRVVAPHLGHRRPEVDYRTGIAALEEALTR